MTPTSPSFSLEAPQKTFSVQPLINAHTEERPIKLNIAEIELTKRLIEQQKLKTGRLTGNVILDTFYRINDWFISKSRVSYRDKAIFFRLMAVMINAGVPLIRALDTLSAQMSKVVKLSRIILEMARKVESGAKFSDTLRSYPDVFSEAEVGMLRSGEATGQLNQVLSQIATQLEKAAGLRSKVIGALIYPAVVIALLVGVVIVMMVVIVPKMMTFFISSGKELPLPTRILITLSHFFQNYWMPTMLGVIGVFLAINVWKKTPAGRYEWDSFKLKIPLIGKLLKKSLLAQFMRQFSDLLTSGIQITQALRIVAGSLNNQVYRQRLELAAQDIEQGIPLAETLNDPRLFPGMIVNMLQVGEQTAHLEVVSEKVADYFDEEVDAMVKGLTKAFEPIMLIVIGTVVGGMVAAIMLPIMDLSNIAGA